MGGPGSLTNLLVSGVRFAIGDVVPHIAGEQRRLLRQQLAPPLEWHREEELARYVALLDREKLGYDMTCFINVSLQRHQLEGLESFRTSVSELPQRNHGSPGAAWINRLFIDSTCRLSAVIWLLSATSIVIRAAIEANTPTKAVQAAKLNHWPKPISAVSPPKM